jgi:hypothetical protein
MTGSKYSYAVANAAGRSDNHKWLACMWPCG